MMGDLVAATQKNVAVTEHRPKIRDGNETHKLVGG
jgi:hypothetical protein